MEVGDAAHAGGEGVERGGWVVPGEGGTGHHGSLEVGDRGPLLPEPWGALLAARWRGRRLVRRVRASHRASRLGSGRHRARVDVRPLVAR